MRAYLSEFIGTAALLAVVAGSGIMGDQLFGGNAGMTLLANSLMTGAGLYVLISLLGPYSGAHFNPAVSFVASVNGDLEPNRLMAYIVCQLIGGIAGIMAVHLMFDLPLLQHSLKVREGFGLWFSEFLSTWILLSVIDLGKKREASIPMLVALTVTAGYWFTASTFFANPAATLARSFTNTFVGIAPISIFGFIVAQLLAVAVFLIQEKTLQDQA